MLDTIFATKGEMTQVWTKQGKRLPVTRCKVDTNIVLGQQRAVISQHDTLIFSQKPVQIFEIGYGKKKLKNTAKPLRSVIEKSGFSFGVKQVRGVRVENSGEETQDQVNDQLKLGAVIKIDQVLTVGDLVKVQGISKGRGFSGVIKRHGMHGGPKTQGQSDRSRAVGSIGSQTPGRVRKGKRMPGHYGTETSTVMNLIVVHVDFDLNEIWLSGPVPGHLNSIVKITKIGKNKPIQLDAMASGLPEKNETKSADLKSETVEQNDSEQPEQPEQENKEPKQENKETKPIAK
jgi:large subunit ribosomal protein L3